MDTTLLLTLRAMNDASASRCSDLALFRLFGLQRRLPATLLCRESCVPVICVSCARGSRANSLDEALLVCVGSRPKMAWSRAFLSKAGLRIPDTETSDGGSRWSVILLDVCL